ncbi:MAG: hypothetical protein JNL21_40215 [Myxococcales bacterium]|nr:hypothetical protein [Myxococcales bacterium]
MNKLSFPLFVTALTLAAFPAFGDSRAEAKHAGQKGYVAAYAADQSTVLDVQACDAKGAGHDYVECGKHLRERVKSEICQKNGKGKQVWYYQVSDGSKSKHTTNCK